MVSVRSGALRKVGGMLVAGFGARSDGHTVMIAFVNFSHAGFASIISKTLTGIHLHTGISGMRAIIGKFHCTTSVERRGAIHHGNISVHCINGIVTNRNIATHNHLRPRSISHDSLPLLSGRGAGRDILLLTLVPCNDVAYSAAVPPSRLPGLPGLVSLADTGEGLPARGLGCASTLRTQSVSAPLGEGPAPHTEEHGRLPLRACERVALRDDGVGGE